MSVSARAAAKQKPIRLRAEQEPGLGDRRYVLIQSAARRISQAIHAGYWLEAVTLVESILSERLEKRAQFLHGHAGNSVRPSLAKVKDGFANLGPLVIALTGLEPDRDLQLALTRVDQWRGARNGVVHEMAKLGTGARDSWSVRLQKARRIAADGVEVLLAYDRAERRVCHEGRGMRRASATCPDALASLGQPSCGYCSSEHGDAGAEIGERVRSRTKSSGAVPRRAAAGRAPRRPRG